MTAQDSPPSAATERPLGLARREDLVVRSVFSPEGVCHRIKDPITLRYFEFTAEEYFVWAQLRPETTLREVRDRFQLEFVPRQVSTAELQQFLLALIENRLVDRRQSPGQDPWMLSDRSPAGIGTPPHSPWSALLFHRFRGFNPTPLLDHLVHLFKRCPPWLFRGLLVLPPLAALWLLVSDPDRMRGDLASWSSTLSVKVWASIAVVLWLCRGIHELAHGVACRWQGAECPELGVQWLLLSPVLYCDVSDTWLLPNRVDRVLVTAVGPLTDLWLAACGFLVAAVVPVEPVQSVAHLVALFCVANTLLLNGNPLLKYDGYHVLCDVADEPNLADKARDWWLGRCSAICLGITPVESSVGRVRHPGLVAIYGLAAAFYRPWIWGTLIVGAGAWLTKAGYPQLGLLAAGLLALVLLGPWLGKLRRTLENPLFWSRLDSDRSRVTAAVFATLLAAFCLLPLPRSVRAIARVDAPGAHPLFVVVPGRLDMAVTAGTEVRQGALLARLSNPELLRQRERLWGEVQQLEFRLRSLEARRLESPEGNLPVSATEESLLAARQQLAQLDADLRRLEIRATRAGRFWPPPWKSNAADQSQLSPSWSGSPLDDFNRGCWLEIGTLLGQIGSPSDLSILLELDGSDADLIQVGQSVKVVLDHAAHLELTGVVSEVGLRVLNPDQQFAPGAGSRTDRTMVAARMTREPVGQELLLRDSGTARISVAWSSAANRVWDWLQSNFRPRVPRGEGID
jgi:putative peptide zinc metalloprotease protein